ncbi:protein ARV 1-like [Pyrus communis]|uniref:protein ARV 1-like n=1 Tax=Pyrus communis TaxID=23211 RepID=UPI0035C21DB0
MGLVHELRFVTLEISKDADGYCLWNIMFFSTFVLAMRILFSAFPRPLRYKELLLAIFISSYFKMFLIAMMGWECPVILIIDLFVSSSNTGTQSDNSVTYE